MKQVVMTNRRNQFQRRVALESCRCRPCWFLAARHRNSLSRAGAIASCSIAIIAIARLQHCHGKIAPFGHLPRHCTRGRGCGLRSQLPSCNQSTHNQRKGEQRELEPGGCFGFGLFLSSELCFPWLGIKWWLNGKAF